MANVFVRILHPEPRVDAGPLERLLADARRANAEDQARGFRSAGAFDVEIVSGPPDDTPFDLRLRSLVVELDGRPVDRRHGWGLVVLGSGAIPLATAADRRELVDAAAARTRSALANNRYSADVVAIARVDELPALPHLAADNGLPRWLTEGAGWRVADLIRRGRLAVDIDSPLDIELIHPGTLPEPVGAAVRTRRAEIATVMADPHAELAVAGRSSAATLRWLETRTAARVRAIIEERGLRSAAASQAQRPPRSILAMVLEHEGPARIGAILGQLGDAALVDTRVLLADRCGSDEKAWPAAEERFASDLLLPDRIADPWLRALTAAARDASIPILLGGHSLVGPGVPLLSQVLPGKPGRPLRAISRDG